MHIEAKSRLSGQKQGQKQARICFVTVCSTYTYRVNWPQMLHPIISKLNFSKNLRIVRVGLATLPPVSGIPNIVPAIKWWNIPVEHYSTKFSFSSTVVEYSTMGWNNLLVAEQ